MGVTIVVGVALYLGDRLRGHRKEETAGASTETPADGTAGEQKSAETEATQLEQPSSTVGTHGPLCCGRHLVCEKYPPADKIIYYDDEELDRYAGRSGEDYTVEEIEEFQEVLMTLRPEDAFGWSRSIEQRQIALPPVVRDELMLIITDATID